MISPRLSPLEIEALHALVLGVEVRRSQIAESVWRRLVELGYVVETLGITDAGTKALHETTVAAFHHAIRWVVENGKGIVRADEQTDTDSHNSRRSGGDGEDVPGRDTE